MIAQGDGRRHRRRTLGQFSSQGLWKPGTTRLLQARRPTKTPSPFRPLRSKRPAPSVRQFLLRALRQSRARSQFRALEDSGPCNAPGRPCSATNATTSTPNAVAKAGRKVQTGSRQAARRPRICAWRRRVSTDAPALRGRGRKRPAAQWLRFFHERTVQVFKKFRGPCQRPSVSRYRFSSFFIF